MQLKPWKDIFAAAVLIATTAFAHAAPIVVDFTTLPDGLGLSTQNFVSKGVVFSPSCHMHIPNHEAGGEYVDVPASGGNWLGFDSSGCDTYFNDDYLGSDIGSPGKMFLALVSGQTFNLLSFDFVRLSESGPGLMNIYSSRGGYFPLRKYDGYGYANYSFSGDAWSNLEWVVFSNEGLGAPSGFDNLTLERVVGQVPEPGSSAAWLALLGAMFVLRRARWH